MPKIHKSIEKTISIKYRHNGDGLFFETIIAPINDIRIEKILAKYDKLYKGFTRVDYSVG